MSLSAQLAEFKAQRIHDIPAATRAVMADNLEELRRSGIEQQAPKVGDILSDFTLPNQNEDTRNLTALLKKGPVVITFYRGGWCPYCNLELRAYQQALPDIQAHGATLIAITPELPDGTLTTLEKNELGFEILTDAGSTYGKQIGIVFTLTDAIKAVYTQFGLDLEKHNGSNQFDLPIPATFVLDTDGRVAYSGIDADYTNRADIEDVLAALAPLTK